MAITWTARGTNRGTTAVGVTGFTAGAGNLVVADVYGRASFGAPTTPAVGGGLSWTEVLDTGDQVSGTGHYQVKRFVAVGDGTTATTATTQTPGGTSPVAMVSVFELSGADSNITNSNFNFVTSGGDPSISLSTPDAASTVIGTAFCPTTNNFTPSGSYSTLQERSSGTDRINTSYDDASASATVAWTSAGGIAIAVASEFFEAAAGGLILPRSRMGTRWMTAKRF